MKNILIVILALALLALGALCTFQARKSSTQENQVVALQNDLEDKARQIETLLASQERAEQTRQELIAQTYQLTAQVHARQIASTNPANTFPSRVVTPDSPSSQGTQNPGLGNLFSKMMQDPDTRQMVRTTQRMMMDQLYAPLISKMGLSSDDASKFKDLLADNAMGTADKASSMLGGSDAANRSGLVASMAADQKNFDEQVKAFLGDARYAQYQDYQQTIAQRMQLNAFKQQAGSDYNLSDQQSEALLSIMNEEQKKAIAAGTLASSGSASDASMLGLVSEDKMNAVLQTQQSAAEQVLDRARSILTPEQLAAFANFQTNQLQMMRMGMNMARKMFGPDQSGTAMAPSN